CARYQVVSAQVDTGIPWDYW
nr:immunoglobulin heavy chain junction region [Macaca mulatta]